MPVFVEMSVCYCLVWSGVVLCGIEVTLTLVKLLVVTLTLVTLIQLPLTLLTLTLLSLALLTLGN